MMFLIQFWRNLTKKDSVESAKYEIKKCILVLTVLGRFLWIRIRIFPDRIRIFGRSGSGKNYGSETMTVGTVTAYRYQFWQLIPPQWISTNIKNTKQKLIRPTDLLACLRSSVTAYLSFICRTLLPPLFFLGPSTGAGRARIFFTGGGSTNQEQN